MRVDARCNSNAESLRFTSNDNAAPVLDAETKEGDVYMLVALVRITTDKLVLAATRVVRDESLIGIATIKTVPSAQLRLSIHLLEFGPIDFVPTNRDASVSAVAPGVPGEIVVLPVAGAYSVKSQDGHGEAAGGLVVLRFALRDASLPGHLSEAALASYRQYIS